MGHHPTNAGSRARGPTLDHEILQVDGRIHIVLKGDLDLATSETLERSVAAVDGSKATVVVDLRDVAFMDSTGLRALWVIRQRIASVGGKTLLASPSAAVMRILSTTKLDKVFEFTDVAAPGEGA